MKRYSTVILKIALFIIMLPVLALSIYGVPWLARNPVNPDYANILYPILIGMYVSSIPFYIALFKANQLLCYIDKNKAFSQISVNALNNIKYCAIAFSTLYVVMMPFVYFVAEKDDAPGLVIVGLVPIFASMVIAVFSAVLQRLLQDAIDLKSENDLTV